MCNIALRLQLSLRLAFCTTIKRFFHVFILTVQIWRDFEWHHQGDDEDSDCYLQD